MKINELPTPCYVIDEGRLEENLKILKNVEDRTGAHILLAQKCFSGFCEYPLIAEYISGTTASGLYEARLGYEEMASRFGRENHVYSPAYREEDMEELAGICDHIVFNSKAQLLKYKTVIDAANVAGNRGTALHSDAYSAGSTDISDYSSNEPSDVVSSAVNIRVNPDNNCILSDMHYRYSDKDCSSLDNGRKHNVSIGVRVNPECSTQEGHAIYDPCSPGSRMGIKLQDFDEEIMSMIDGIHFHTLCEQNSDDLEITLHAVEEKFGPYLHRLKWLNMGGGHHITRKDYDVERLIRLIKHMKETYDLEIYLEPGEAVALNAGYNVTKVLDIVKNDIPILILDTSAACHMPDVLEMPYRPPLKDSGEAGEKLFTYRLSCNTCLAGDVIGEYSFDHEIKVGDRLYFEDMAIYSMVKNNTFNGIPLPAIAAMDRNGDCRIIKEFGYEDFKMRLS
ncbi:MAG: carboxynorspermidine decarboxylase [Parasporobacterium sp.]|nr:carboxynorspermidine decarboxylase [Parasporobacterium sp.]